MSLSKNEIIDLIQEGLGDAYSRSQASEIIEILLEIIKGTLENGDDVLILARPF